MQNFPVTGLDFNEIKTNFKTFVQNDPAATFSDFNYEGSGINALLNIFAYNAHYLGYYIKMLLNESFIDSAVKRESLVSRGKLNAYTPMGIKTARAKIQMDLTLDPEQMPENNRLVFPAGYSFSGNNYLDDDRRFQTLESIATTEFTENYETIESIPTLVSYTFHTPEFVVYEGQFRDWKFEVDNNDLSQQFIIQDKNIDLETLNVYIHPNVDSTDREEFTLAADFFTLDNTSKVFFITTTSDGYFEIFFGNNVFGEKPSTGNMISISYVISSGEDGNGCSIFSNPSRTINGTDLSVIFNDYDYKITTIENSNGGMIEETIEELRFNIPNHFKRQNRLVTERDYKTLLLEKFRNIDSINVWGGEKHFFKDYGCIYVCIKPKTGLLLTQTAKLEIENYVEKYAVIGNKIKVIQPDYLWVDLDFTVKYDPSITSLTKEQIKNIIYGDIQNFNEIYLDKFDLGLSDINLLNYIKIDKNYIKRIFDIKRLSKTLIYTPNTSTEHFILFGNALVQNSITSDQLRYNQNSCYIMDNAYGQLYLVDDLMNKLIPQAIGSIDYNSGTIKLVIDFNLDLTVNVDETFKIYATPKYPDIDTYLNNIIKINQINVTIS